MKSRDCLKMHGARLKSNVSADRSFEKSKGRSVFSSLNTKEKSLLCRYLGYSKGRQGMINQMVLSPEIEWIGYERNRSMLQVEFIIGNIFQYDNVPESIFDAFLSAPSHDSFYERFIKGKFLHRKVR